MTKIKIRNFGPIKDGYIENDGFLEIKKVTLFIGNQGSGKSTIAKVLSTLLWIEKSINRGDLSTDWSFNDFIEKFKYQNLTGYFRKDTIIDYRGELYSICYDKPNMKYPIIEKTNLPNYAVPKIMYVPSERNFLSVIKDAYRVRGLPEPLFEFAEELRKAQMPIGNTELLLPINNVYYKYDEVNEMGIIFNASYSVNMTVASSGFQSFVPLFLVSHHLAHLVAQADNKLNSNLISVNQKIKIDKQIAAVMLSTSLSDEEKLTEVSNIKSKFISTSFINIVEEPEQNLYPSSQHAVLNSLLALNNLNEQSKLIITTHSPYLVNYLTLAVKAEMLKASTNSDDLRKTLDQVVPLNATVSANELVIYELNEQHGNIKKLETFDGLPSDENLLNEMLGETNEHFAQLLEIQERI
jgi:predicted ATPase